MSFSSIVKAELSLGKNKSTRHCDIALILAFINNNAIISHKYGRFALSFQTDNEACAKLFFELINRTFNCRAQVRYQYSKKQKRKNYLIYLRDEIAAEKILHATGRISNVEVPSSANKLVLKNECCKRNYLRASFMQCGSLCDPRKSYHLEFVFLTSNNAIITMDLLSYFQLNPKMIGRKKHFVVYLKEGENIADLLNIMGAHNSLLEFENIRVIKNVSNNINRKVNCETANISKTVIASLEYEQDIIFIEKSKGLSFLAKPLMEVAEARLENPNATLKEIGEMLAPPISKSGVNHRLRKISDIAEKLRRD